MLSLIVCVDSQYGIGKSNDLPWYIPEDLKHFKNITSGHTVVMGRNTWESIPDKVKPLKNRENIVLSRTLDDDRCIVFNDHWDLIKHLGKKQVFIIGGSHLYKLFLELRMVDKIYMTRLTEDHNCDIFFPKQYMESYKEISQKELCPNVISYEYEYHNQEEQQYLTIMKDIYNNGIDMDDRTGVGTRSLFVKQMKFDLRNNTIPLLTTKRVFFRGIVEETLFFLSGSTDVRKLREKGVFYWDGNTSREFLDKRGLTHLQEYDMGATYSFLYRHFGAEYQGMDKDYTGKGFDQVQYVIDEIKNNPTSRRIMINVWDPNSLDKCTLPPCQFCHIFYVNTKTNEISMNTNIRSSDGFLGLAYNLINASIILRLVCHCTGYKPGDLYVTTNNTHIYHNHFEAVEKQLQRNPNRTFPKLLINGPTNIFDITFENFELLNYNPRPNIKAPMAI